MFYDPRKKIDKLMTERHCSRSTLAHNLNISLTSVNNWYNKKNAMPSVRTLEQISLFFNISILELFTDLEFNKFTPKEISLIELFRQLTEKQQESIITIISELLSCQTN